MQKHNKLCAHSHKTLLLKAPNIDVRIFFHRNYFLIVFMQNEENSLVEFLYQFEDPGQIVT